jgi:hypothetical protein
VSTAWTLPPERDAPRAGTGPKVPELFRTGPDSPTSGGGTVTFIRKGIDNYDVPVSGSAAPGVYLHTLSVGDQITEARVYQLVSHTTLDRVGPDRVSARKISRLNGGLSQREAHGLDS